MKQFISLEEAVDELQEIEGRDEQISFLENVKILDIIRLPKEISETEKALENCKNANIPKKLAKRQKETELHLENKLKVLRLIESPKEKILITREEFKKIKFSDNEKIFLDAIIKIVDDKDMFLFLLMILQKKFPNNAIEIVDAELFEIWFEWDMSVNKEDIKRRINFAQLKETMRYNKEPWNSMDSFSIAI